MSDKEIYNLTEYLNSVKSLVERIELKEVFDVLIPLEKELTKLEVEIKEKESKNEEDNILSYRKKKLEELINEKLKDLKKIDYKFFYRGHYLTNNLSPKVFRNNELHREDYYYHEIIVRCPEKFRDSSHLDKLVTMQHYGLPTRLLDVTTNPLVALYFACKNFGCKHCEKTIDAGEVFVFAVPSDSVLYYNSDKSLILSSLSRFRHNEKMDILNECYNKIKIGKIFDANKNANIIERLYHEIRTEVPSFEKKIKPIDILSSFFIQPQKTNSRMLKQDGAFIINGLSKNEKEITEKLNDLVYKRIKIKNQDKILEDLDRLGINEATLFPEMDKVANYLKNN